MAKPLQNGQVIKSFTLSECLFQGVEAAVWKAADQNTGKVCAIKLLNENLVEEPTRRKAIAQEGIRQNSVRHPNVVAMKGRIEESPHHGYVMEFVDGPTLSQYLSNNPVKLDLQEVKSISTGILSGLNAIHRQGMIHRNICPENILMARTEPYPVPKIIDFGLALKEDETKDYIGDELFDIGGLSYQSPEALSESARLSSVSDIYSFGVLLFVMLTGHTPFEAADTETLRHLIAKKERSSISLYRPDIPLPIGRMLSRCLEPVVLHRPQSCLAVLEELLEIDWSEKVHTAELPALGSAFSVQNPPLEQSESSSASALRGIPDTETQSRDTARMLPVVMNVTEEGPPVVDDVSPHAPGDLEEETHTSSAHEEGDRAGEEPILEKSMDVGDSDLLFDFLNPREREENQDTLKTRGPLPKVGEKREEATLEGESLEHPGGTSQEIPSFEDEGEQFVEGALLDDSRIQEPAWSRSEGGIYETLDDLDDLDGENLFVQQRKRRGRLVLLFVAIGVMGGGYYVYSKGGVTQPLEVAAGAEEEVGEQLEGAPPEEPPVLDVDGLTEAISAEGQVDVEGEVNSIIESNGDSLPENMEEPIEALVDAPPTQFTREISEESPVQEESRAQPVESRTEERAQDRRETVLNREPEPYRETTDRPEEEPVEATEAAVEEPANVPPRIVIGSIAEEGTGETDVVEEEDALPESLTSRQVTTALRSQLGALRGCFDSSPDQEVRLRINVRSSGEVAYVGAISAGAPPLLVRCLVQVISGVEFPEFGDRVMNIERTFSLGGM